MGIFSKEECKISNPEDEAVFTFKMHSNPELLLQQLSIIICPDQNLLIRFYDLYSLIWITLNNNIWNNSNAKKSILLKILTISNLLTVLGNKHFPTANEKHPNIFFFFLNRTNYIFLAGIGEKCVNMFNILYCFDLNYAFFRTIRGIRTFFDNIEKIGHLFEVHFGNSSKKCPSIIKLNSNIMFSSREGIIHFQV